MQVTGLKEGLFAERETGKTVLSAQCPGTTSVSLFAHCIVSTKGSAFVALDHPQESRPWCPLRQGTVTWEGMKKILASQKCATHRTHGL